MHRDNNDLQRAIDALTVQDVWRKAGLADCPREGNHLVKSPFREDRKKSFSICYRGRGWKDHATSESGGVWQFAQRALGKDGKELADALIDLSGIVRSPVRARENGAGRTEQGGEPAEFRPSRRAKPKPYPGREALMVIQAERSRALLPKVQAREVVAWSAAVAGRWRQGSADAWERVTCLADGRGWPESWVLQLLELDLLAWPLLPWCDTRRGRDDELAVAFKVEAPLLGVSGEFKGLREVGYHQRFEIRGEKSWVYVPYLPKEDRCRSEFQQGLRAECGPDFPGIPGLPFVLPGGAECRVLVITEGQWDAISFAGACGWLDSDTAWPDGWWVMGVRGANGADTLLAYWGAWLRRWKPRVLVLADNDKAGLWWDNARMAGEDRPWGGPWELGVVPSFAEKLRANGCPLVSVRRVDRAIGKDFNDYWKAKRPAASGLMAWLGKLGFDTKKKAA